MGRWIILGVIVAVALTVYAVVDCAMASANRSRIFRKPVWLVIVLLLPVVGPLLWMFMGRGTGADAQPAPDDDLDYLRRISSDEAHDARIRDLEEQMRKLDDEIEQARRSSMGQHPSSGTGSVPVIEPEEGEEFRNQKRPESDAGGARS